MKFHRGRDVGWVYRWPQQGGRLVPAHGPRMPSDAPRPQIIFGSWSVPGLALAPVPVSWFAPWWFVTKDCCTPPAMCSRRRKPPRARGEAVKLDGSLSVSRELSNNLVFRRRRTRMEQSVTGRSHLRSARVWRPCPSRRARNHSEAAVVASVARQFRVITMKRLAS